MPIPLVIWAAAGIGAAGLKLYRSATSAESMVKNAIDRYSEERYKFYKKLDELLPQVEALGELKVRTWTCYDKVFVILETLQNLPGHYTFKSHKNLHILPQDLRRLKKVVKVAQRIRDKGLAKEGTGMLTILALQGGAASSYSQTELARDEAKLVMEKMLDQPLYTSEVTALDEMAVLESVMGFPKVLRPGYFANKNGKNMTKDEASRFKEETDAQSLLLADAQARADRLLDVVNHVLKTMETLKLEQHEQIEFFQSLVLTKTDYNEFTLEEKDRLNFVVSLGFVLRELARTDIVMKNGNMSIINRTGLRSPLGKAKDLLPVENRNLMEEQAI